MVNTHGNTRTAPQTRITAR